MSYATCEICGNGIEADHDFNICEGCKKVICPNCREVDDYGRTFDVICFYLYNDQRALFEYIVKRILELEKKVNMIQSTKLLENKQE